MKLSKRALEIQASPIRKLMPHAVDAKSRGIKVYHLNIGQPDIPTPPQMMKVYHEFSEKVLAYGPSQGLEVYQQGLVHYYKRLGISLDTKDIIVTTAGSEAVTFAMMVAANEGDEIIVPEPFYTNYNGFATMASIKLQAITTLAENGFALPNDEAFEALIGPKTRAIMLCNPGNPTGAVYSNEELFRVAALCKKHGLFLISDEVYREFIYDGLCHTSVLQIPDFDANAIMVDSVSKRYSACGARIGCIVSRNRDLMSATLKFAQARLCPPTIDQLAANACVYLPDEYFHEMVAEYQSRRDLVYNELTNIDGIICKKPQGAFYIVAKLPIENAEDFVTWMLDEFQIDGKTVMAAPAEGFYATPGLGKNELRLAYILNKEALKDAMRIFRAGLTEYKKTHK
ncbi:MAG: pyridoxal phosphate-dependent aminotransferase [Candidatus Cloacimonadales bacterium]|jgi:aspartate aminotransferase|nr:pyridoxal phosphate-dependent aminotransferase [Candidatus Cloacimonadota bacterium]MDY0381165.1 pyridoxal phosphate-dependent aminotransferase [Candidatus Cloacimonadaceae bacterium]MCB5256016.1 pyridoxal phosphate-dependent aminotransferase [Candidatus Cloacimonadota bacterium]MCB5263302.1 pyridoxal phosphate-dependent aminotransferase [Candidatus Cloacimonadota bacterium]MCB5276869.1 pyridoxal phosphate-dependent aminotransferase [Candidatus Cloacimonadota bacterium]